MKYAFNFVTYVFKMASGLNTIQYLSDLKHKCDEDKK